MTANERKPPITADRLIAEFTEAIHRKDAALFIGSGLSRASGFVDWKGLMTECATELGLDVGKEHDLVAVAQYYLNEHNFDRSLLNQLLVNEFKKPGHRTRNHDIIARLPIPTLWTTNFDNLIEEAFTHAGRTLEVRATDESIGFTIPGRSATLYKMHGDVATPKEIIICKDDYERYARVHPAIQNMLEAHLLAQNMLFLGFSFTDPHLDYMLGHLRSLLGNNKRPHYAVMRQAHRNDFKNGTAGDDEYEYERNKQALRIRDLERYSIRTALVDQYEQITDILAAIEQQTSIRNVLISGSATRYENTFPRERLEQFCKQLGGRLIDENYNIVTGFGLGVGSAIVMGALEKIYAAVGTYTEERLILRPFPGTDTGPAVQTKHREDMVSPAGIVLFVAGNREGHEIAPGVIEEYEIARRLGKILIPIGATGFAARKLWQDLRPEVATLYRGRVPADLFARLGDTNLRSEELIAAIITAIAAARTP